MTDQTKESLITPSRGYIVFDPELCTGCHVCEAVCSFVKEGSVWPEMSRIQVHMDPFKGTVEPLGYKAFIVGVDREACCLLKEALNQYLPDEYSRVVISPGHNDPPGLTRYHLSDQEEKDTRKAFIKTEALPKILIVTEKLLTGYDAPVLYCMYLDKPMRDHVLLQAIARVKNSSY